MPLFIEHCEKSVEKFGEDGAEYHKWIDQYTTEGYRHRQVLHNKEGVEVGVQLFGEKARKHLEQHIKDDYSTDKIPSIQDLRGYPRATDGLKEKKKDEIKNKIQCDNCAWGFVLNINKNPVLCPKCKGTFIIDKKEVKK